MQNTIIPTPENLPVHWFWFQLLLILTFTLHLIFMNMILGGSLLTLIDRIKGEKSKIFSKNIPILVALTINLGVPPLLFVQVMYGQFFYASSVLMAAFWILVIPILILAYYGTYIYIKKAKSAPKWSIVSLVIATIFMLYIAFMFVNNSTLSIQPNDWLAYFRNQNGTILHFTDHSIWPRFLHFILASVAIAAIARSLFYQYSKKVDQNEKQRVIRYNLKIVAWVTIIQILIGSWFWLSMPEKVWKLFMGGQVSATIFMILGWIIALGIIYHGFVGKLKVTLILGLLQVIIMVIIRDYSRGAYLHEIFHPSQLEVVHQWTPLVLFLLVFIIGLGSIYYMIKLTQKSKNE